MVWNVAILHALDVLLSIGLIYFIAIELPRFRFTEFAKISKLDILLKEVEAFGQNKSTIFKHESLTQIRDNMKDHVIKVVHLFDGVYMSNKSLPLSSWGDIPLLASHLFAEKLVSFKNDIFHKAIDVSNYKQIENLMENVYKKWNFEAKGYTFQLKELMVFHWFNPRTPKVFLYTRTPEGGGSF